MRSLTILCILITLSSLSTACAPISTEPEISCRETISAISSLTRNLRLPDHLLHEDAKKTGSEFDVNAYFTVLKRLSIPSGYTLDYFYYYGGIGGEPVLYVRPIDQPAFQSLADYKRANGQFSLADTAGKFIEGVRTDETDVGFLQLIALHVMGNQFYQYWHAGYNDYRIVCGRAELEDILFNSNGFGRTIPLDVQIRARLLDVTPAVKIDGNTVQVQVVVFTKWGGFLRRTYTLMREYPHVPLQVENETLVDYDCGVAY